MTETLGVILTTVAAGVAALILVAVIRIVSARRRQSRPADQEPAHRPATTTRTVLLRLLRKLVRRRPPVPVWRGATPGWSPAAAVARVDTDPNLITPVMHMRADHAALAPISTALDEFSDHVSAALARFLRDDPQTLLRLPSSVEDTEWLDTDQVCEQLGLPAARELVVVR